MALEQTVGDISQRIHHGFETFEKSLEPPLIFLDKLADKLDWIRYIPSVAEKNSLVCVTISL